MIDWFAYYEDRYTDPDYREYDYEEERMAQAIDDAWEREMDDLWE